MSHASDHSSQVAMVERPLMVAQPTTSAARLPHRLPFNFIEPLALAGDLLVILAASLFSGIGYQWLFLNNTGDPETFLAIGALVFANFFALTRAQQNYQVTNLINFARQIRYVSLNWIFIFFVLIAVAFTLKITQTFSRGSTLSFLAIGWTGLISYRGLLARYLKRALNDGAFAKHKIILISERGQQATSRALAELNRCGYLPTET